MPTEITMSGSLDLTFLFTDIEGSTARWDADRQAMAAALRRHDALLRAAIVEHGGHVFKTVGDAFCAAFNVPEDALAAAVTAQLRLAAEDWSAVDSGFAPLLVRMALHAGDAEARDEDYFGPTLNRCARILAAGYGGQVLLSRTVHEALGPPPFGVDLHDMGTHRLKDLTRPEHLYQVVVDGLPSEFPALRTLDRRAHGLPIQPTPLIGRQAEVAAALDSMRQPELRLLTLTGPGGTGKTRLAMQIAAELIEEFEDGVYFVAMAALSEPALVGAAIAESLGARDDPERSLADVLKQRIGDGQLLLVLDNFEQVVEAAPLVAELLAAAPRLKVLATSRVSLRLTAERELAVPPLALPDRRRSPSLASISASDAARLFVERSQAVRAEFSVTEANAATVAQICWRLDGLPLALELAAARMRVLTPELLLARLDQSLSLLTTGPRDLPARQQTLRATIGWSYELMGAAEQRVFRRLGVFVGGCSLEAAVSVCETDGVEVLDALSALVESNLVQRSDEDGDVRFSMLETIREFALGEMAKDTDAHAVRDLHAEQFLRIAESTRRQWDRLAFGDEEGADGRTAAAMDGWNRRLSAEVENLRATIHWLLLAPHGDERIVRLALDLANWANPGMRWEEKRQWALAALEHSRSMTPLLHARMQTVAAGHEVMVGRFQHAEQWLLEALATLQGAADERWTTLCLEHLGKWHLESGDPSGSEMYFEQALALYRAGGNMLPSSAVILCLGEAARMAGNESRSAACYEESIHIARTAMGEAYQPGWPETNLAFVLRRSGQATRSAALLFAVISANPDDEYLQLVCTEGLAGVALASGSVELAAQLLGAVDTWLAQGITRMQRVDQLEFERDLAEAREQLDADVWDSAWAAGHQLTPEEAVALALAIADGRACRLRA